MESKYVAGRHVGGCSVAIIIPGSMAHSDIRHLFKEITSAGFVSIGTNLSGDMNISVYGESVSLGVKADEKDLGLVKNALGMPSYW